MENSTMYVYLDSALIYQACDRPELLERLNRLTRLGITYVFSRAHLVDIFGQETPDDVLRLTSRLAKLDRAVWRTCGDDLASLELAHLLNGVSGVQETILPRPDLKLKMTWAMIHAEVQSDPEAALGRWRAVRAKLEQMSNADELSRDAEQIGRSGEKSGFVKAIQKFADGKGSERDLTFAKARRTEQERRVDRNTLEEAVCQARLALDLLKVFTLPQIEQIYGSTDRTAVRAAFSELRNATRAGSELLEAGPEDASLHGPVCSRLQLSFVVLARVLNLLGRPEDAVLSPVEHEVYPQFELYYRQTLPLVGRSELDEPEKRSLFRAWTEASTGTCKAGYLLARIRRARASRIDLPRSKSDYADMDHVSQLPYVDVMFVDKRFHELMRGIRSDFSTLFSRLRKNEDFSKWLDETECLLAQTD